MIVNWYDHYESQCWYRNSFLVNKFEQISRANSGDREWNNIEDSGCNFVCLAMILGINPAHLASELGKQNFFRVDRNIRSIYLRNSMDGYLIWDINGPDEALSQVTIRQIYHPEHGNVGLAIKFIKIETAINAAQANKIIRSRRAVGHHIICGFSDHSRLVAGESEAGYFLWDPDSSETPMEDSLSGLYSIDHFFTQHEEQHAAEFWSYRVNYLTRGK